MTIYVKDPTTSAAVRKLARQRGVTLTEAIRLAVEKALVEEEGRKAVVMAKVKTIQEEVARWPKSGLQADKAFYDGLSGEV